MIPQQNTVCAECNGEGSYWFIQSWPLADGESEHEEVEATCPECKGTGYVMEEVR